MRIALTILIALASTGCESYAPLTDITAEEHKWLMQCSLEQHMSTCQSSLRRARKMKVTP